MLSPGGVICGVDFLRQDGIDDAVDGFFLAVSGIPMKYFRDLELKALFSDFVDWACRSVAVSSLSGCPVRALQYTARVKNLG